jgi:hypothetical protein
MLPESSPGKQRRNCWLRVGTITKYVVVRSKVGWFLGHWSAKLRRTIRCSGESCTICASGAEPRVFTYVFVHTEDHEVLVWEIPERLFALAQEIEQSLMQGPGCVLALSREGTAINARLSASIVGFEEVDELDITAFVETLGVTLLPASTPQKVVPASKHG